MPPEAPEGDDQAGAQYAAMIGRPVATTLPCPAWCDLPAGHPFETTDPEENPLRAVGSKRPSARGFRVHRRRFGDRPTHVALETYERSDDCGSDLGTDPDATLVRIQLPGGYAHLTAAGALRLADQLQRAAALAEERWGLADESAQR